MFSHSARSAPSCRSSLTYKERGVNGRTLLDTQTAGNSRIWRSPSSKDRPILIGIVLFVFALVMELLINWSGDVSDTASLGWLGGFGHLIGTTLSNLLSPAL